MQTFAIFTLGCKVNLYESQAISNQLTAQGLIEVDNKTLADIYIINTCSVTNVADLKSRNMIRRAQRLNPHAIVIVVGCYSQVASTEMLKKLNVQIIIGNKYKNQVYELLQNYLTTNHPITKIENLLQPQKFEHFHLTNFVHTTRAFVKIQDGCNFMCSYCSIPFTRGRQRSASLNEVLKQIKYLVDQHYKEIVLTGVNTAGYHDDQHDFYDLLLAINRLPGNFRVRISSVEPFQITDEIINLITSSPDRFCNHWHLCLQSGDNNVLQAMHRHYTIEQFATLLTKIRNKSPLACISTDYIVGFPSETEQQHCQSVAFLKAQAIVFMHIFTYSKRANTAACQLVDLHGSIKLARFKAIDAVNLNNTQCYLKQFINHEVEVLFETYDHGVYQGKSSEYCDVIYKSNEPNLLNKLLNVTIKHVIGLKLIADQHFIKKN